MLAARFGQFCLAILLGSRRLFLRLAQQFKIPGGSLELPLKAMNLMDIHGLPKERAESGLLGDSRFLHMLLGRLKSLFSFLLRPLEGSVSADHLFLRALLAQTAQVAQAGDRLAIIHRRSPACGFVFARASFACRGPDAGNY